MLWPSSTLIVDFLYLRFVIGGEPEAFFNRFAVWWGAPYLLLVVFLAIAPLAAGLSLSRRR